MGIGYAFWNLYAFNRIIVILTFLILNAKGKIKMDSMQDKRIAKTRNKTLTNQLLILDLKPL